MHSDTTNSEITYIRTFDNEFSYDLRALMMAFYPERQYKTVFDESLASEDYIFRIHGPDLEFEASVKRPYTKNDIKNCLYEFLSERSGIELPWGILTGIRPAKIPRKLIEDGNSREDVERIMREEYRCQESKIKLATDIATIEQKLAGDMDHDNSISVYIGIPFCPSICAYCSFSSFSYKQYEKRVDDYIAALEYEMENVQDLLGEKIIRSLYIGGGTPTSLNEEQFERLMVAVEKYFPLDEIPEYTVEAGRPDTITRGKLMSMKSHGVTRISINPQSMQQSTLDALGRKHTIEQIVEAFELARKLGFDNINMDLIVGLANEGVDEFRDTLEKVVELDPDSVTVHTLVIKRASRIRREHLESGSEIVDADDAIEDMQNLAEHFLRKHGYMPYYMYRQKNKAGTTRNTNQENVAYAKPGKECLYNIFIMEEMHSIMALGSGGSTKYVYKAEDGSQRMERVENVKSVEDYISRIDEMIDRKRIK
ncbi:coproporphyrinogen dehydrogenase HemZ [Eubacterium xylanophilum]|uniref:coproporphyrinogen dehydrogenase HemZ n=1 Tax=Eubacterium xylanophilum TaxID=39497 RepID=UPI0004B35A78|nr:coproporphyrinogen dehydrogenase HemZ [Eubacterium xylanophilum]